MVAIIRPERLRISTPGAPRSTDADQRQSVIGTVADTVYAGPLRKYHVQAGTRMLTVREHVASGQQVYSPGDQVRVDWLRSDVRFVTL
ncbi:MULTISPECIES: TOBE domain-containing protein [Rhizobium]|uniref:Transport-associated OB type 2 domain-containing protein n=1 Tax=Rhizobium favelukesii TaxID=348824 RepID=W6S0T2_9HYPH|nr:MULTISPECIES: TOBE domain-containing protein [Rhizobium]MCS0462718.1 TOBE domain-containing protein [Rhizobium favelukesii]UFS85025.1 TOBE domain-containing protein [Rhizobium sp. T136]CDM60086.1 hypothetical protein LPU83_pLPU83b_0087 [Rhizobium favelukesii]